MKKTPKRVPTVEFYGDASFRSFRTQWRWRVTHSNGLILAASSEGFATRSGAKRNFGRVRLALSGAMKVKDEVRALKRASRAPPPDLGGRHYD